MDSYHLAQASIQPVCVRTEFTMIGNPVSSEPSVVILKTIPHENIKLGQCHQRGGCLDFQHAGLKRAPYPTILAGRRLQERQRTLQGVSQGEAASERGSDRLAWSSPGTKAHTADKSLWQAPGNPWKLLPQLLHSTGLGPHLPSVPPSGSEVRDRQSAAW